MAMNRKPKPLRPDTTGTKAEVRGRMSTKPTIKVVPKKPLTKPTLKNLTAPRGTGSGAGSVRILTKSESFMKKDKARTARTGTLPLTKTVTDSMKTTGRPSYKKSTGNQRLIDDTQQITKKGYIGLTAAEKKAMNQKGGKPSKVTPKKTPPAPKPKGKGRFGRGVGGMGGGGLFGGGLRKSK